MHTLKQTPQAADSKASSKRVEFFAKYSRQLETERQKLLGRIRRLENENSELQEKFRGSIEQRDEIKKSADKVMDMLCYLNELIDKFVKPSRARFSKVVTKSEKAMLMDTLCQEKEDFDVNMLGMKKEPVEGQGERREQSQEGRSRPEREELERRRSQVQEELNQSMEKLNHIKNEILDSVLMENRGKTAAWKDPEKQNSMYFSEEKGLDCIPLELGDLPSSHQTEQPRKKTRNFMKVKGKREKVSISIEECNRLFRETLPKSSSKKRYRRKKSRRRRQEQHGSSQTNTQTTRKSSREPKSSVDSYQQYKGLYNRHNSLFHRNKRNHPSKESLMENKKGISVWDKYSLNLPGSNDTRASRTEETI